VSEHPIEHAEKTGLPPDDDAVVSDAEILARYLGGDRDAFGELVRRHGRYLFAVASRIVGRSDAEDVVQTVFLNAVRSADPFEGRSAVRTWLHQIAVHECLNQIRRHPVTASHDLPDDHDESVAADGDIGEYVVGQDLVTELLASLTASTRQMVVLVDLLGYSTAEAARVLGVAEGTVKSRRWRAFARLARRVQR
jgi:RNA polymerase sigma-70 factor (ECF subfamily)